MYPTFKSSAMILNSTKYSIQQQNKSLNKIQREKIRKKLNSAEFSAAFSKVFDD